MHTSICVFKCLIDVILMLHNVSGYRCSHLASPAARPRTFCRFTCVFFFSFSYIYLLFLFMCVVFFSREHLGEHMIN